MKQQLNGITTMTHKIHFNDILNLKALLLLTILIATGSVSEAKAKFTVTADSSYIEMGRTTTLHLKVTNAGAVPGRIDIPVDSLPREIEFVKDSIRTLTPEPGSAADRGCYVADYTIQSFDSGVYRLPALIYIDERDTVFSNRITIKVDPVDVSEMEVRDPDEGVLSAGSEWFDFLPDFVTKNWLMIVFIIIILTAGVCAFLYFRKKRLQPSEPKKIIIPPYELALRNLEVLKGEHLWETGQERSFYTRLTDILREYLQGRFGINAMEMTSSQIRNALKHNHDTVMSKSLVEQVLEIADYVKFAKMKPLREDNIRSYDAALQFVQDTKPVQTEENPSEKNDTKIDTEK